MEKRIFGLDLLRAIAILLVIQSHTAKFVMSQRWTDISGHYLGYIGVELFFVLSGFLIGTILIKLWEQEKRLSFQQIKFFWIRRWFRTLPNYYFAFLVTILCSLWFLGYFPLKDSYSWPYFAFLQNLTHPQGTFLVIAWSLAIEEWFYLTFPLMVVGMQSLFKGSGHKVILYSVVSIVVICLALRIGYSLGGNPGKWSENFRKVVVLRLDAIAIGVGFAYLKFYSAKLWERYRWMMLAGGAILLSLTILYFFQHNLMRGPQDVIGNAFYFPVVSLAFGLMLPAFDAWRMKPSIFTWPVTKIALISYSLYLFHTIVIIAMAYNPWWRWRLEKGYFMAWFFSFVVSALIYYLFERPITNLRDRFGKAKDKVSVQ